jgi:hypothetical protein
MWRPYADWSDRKKFSNYFQMAVSDAWTNGDLKRVQKLDEWTIGRDQSIIRSGPRPGELASGNYHLHSFIHFSHSKFSNWRRNHCIFKKDYLDAPRGCPYGCWWLRWLCEEVSLINVLVLPETI